MAPWRGYCRDAFQSFISWFLWFIFSNIISIFILFFNSKTNSHPLFYRQAQANNNSQYLLINTNLISYKCNNYGKNGREAEKSRLKKKSLCKYQWSIIWLNELQVYGRHKTGGNLGGGKRVVAKSPQVQREWQTNILSQASRRYDKHRT